MNWAYRVGKEGWKSITAVAYEYLMLALLAILMYRQVPGILIGLLVQTTITANLRAKNLRRRNHRLSQMIQSLAALTMMDSQTGLLNKAALGDKYAELHERCVRMGRSCAVLEIDIDGFKNHNDTLGHPYGDTVIERVVAVLKASARGAADLIGRDGGDEFRLVLDGASKEVAIHIAHRICASVANIPSELPIRVSIGIAAIDEAHSADELTQIADQRLYRAKAAGGNQVVFN